MSIVTPTGAWDGLSANPYRTSRADDIPPDYRDWDRIVAELLSVQSLLSVIIGQDGGITLKRTAISDDYTIDSSDFLIAVTDTTDAREITLLPAADMENRILLIKDESGGAGTNNITVTPDGIETIDNASTQVISTNRGSLRLYSNGTTWFILP